MNFTGIMKLLIYYNNVLNIVAHPASYPMGTRGSFPGGKVARV
jgi:hypothetical protein